MTMGDDSKQIEIGGIATAVSSDCLAVLTRLERRYAPFLTQGAESAFSIRLALLADVEPAAFLGVPAAALDPFIGVQRTPSGSDPVSHGQPAGGPNGPVVSEQGELIIIQRRDFAACLDLAARRGRCVFAGNMESIAVESFLRIAYSFLMVEAGGLLLHSAGIVCGEAGYIFFGPSETGKSTIAGFAPPSARVLSDEMIAVQRTGAGYAIHSTPFMGTNKGVMCRASAPLTAGFIPIKAARTFCEPAPRAMGLHKLMASVLFFAREPARGQLMMDTCASILERVPFYHMHFERNNSFWGCIAALGKEGYPC